MLARAGRVLLIILAAVTPSLVPYVGIRYLAAHLASLQPDGDLEAGGGFALAVLLGGVVLLAYATSALMLAVLWRWVSGVPWRALVVVVAASAVVTWLLVALNWS